MELDLFILGNLLIAERHELKTGDFNGNFSNVVGTNNAPETVKGGYLEGHGSSARFNQITSFVQPDKNTVVVIDGWNHCIRKVDRLSRNTTLVAGLCTKPGMKDGLYNKALFYIPIAAAIYYNDPNLVLVVDSLNHALRLVDLATSTVTTLDVHGLHNPKGLHMKPQDGTWFISSNKSLYQLREDNSLDMVSDSYSMPNGTVSKFKNVNSILPLDSQTVLVVDTDSQMVVSIDLLTSNASPVCSGGPGNKNGGSDKCGFYYPYSLMRNKNLVYVGMYRAIRVVEGKYMWCIISSRVLVLIIGIITLFKGYNAFV